EGQSPAKVPAILTVTRPAIAKLGFIGSRAPNPFSLELEDVVRMERLHPPPAGSLLHGHAGERMPVAIAVNAPALGVGDPHGKRRHFHQSAILSFGVGGFLVFKGTRQRRVRGLRRNDLQPAAQFADLTLERRTLPGRRKKNFCGASWTGHEQPWFCAIV